MLIRPMIGSWEVPRIEQITATEARRVATFPVVGLSGDLTQDLGRNALIIDIRGSLMGDEARDTFLGTLREQYLAGEPVDFVADIVGESELEQVLILSFEVAEVGNSPDAFRYHIVLQEYTEPPEPPSGLGGLEPDLDLDVDLGLDMLDLPGMIGDIPQIGDLLSPLAPAAKKLRDTLSNAGALVTDLTSLLG